MRAVVAFVLLCSVSLLALFCVVAQHGTDILHGEPGIVFFVADRFRFQRIVAGGIVTVDFERAFLILASAQVPFAKLRAEVRYFLAIPRFFVAIESARRLVLQKLATIQLVAVEALRDLLFDVGTQTAREAARQLRAFPVRRSRVASILPPDPLAHQIFRLGILPFESNHDGCVDAVFILDDSFFRRQLRRQRTQNGRRRVAEDGRR